MSEEEPNNLVEEQIEEKETDEEEKPQYTENREFGKYSLDELLEMARKGYHIWVDRRYNRIRLRDPETRRTISIPYDEELYRRLKEAKEEARKGKSGEETEQAEEGEKEEKRGRPKKQPLITSDVMLWNTFIGKHRPLIESLIFKIGWLQDAIIDIGMNALLFAMLVSRETPETLKDVLAQIHDKDAFVSYVMDKLHSIYVAAQGLDQIEELKLKIRELEAQVAILYEAVKQKNEELNKYRALVEDLRRKLDMALSIMNRNELKQYMRALIISNMSKYSVEKEAGEEAPQRETVINTEEHT